MDSNFKEYTVEYGEGKNPSIWNPASEMAFAKPVENKQLFQWLPEGKTGQYTLRLTVTDEVGHIAQDSVMVELAPQITKDKGGTANSSDGNVSLNIPPRSLPSDTIITINRVPVDEIQPPDSNRIPEVLAGQSHAATATNSGVKSLNLAFDLGPSALKLRSIKPATLQIKLDSIPAQSKKRVAFFRWNGKWTFLGGTLREDKVNIGITQFGRYALMEVERTFEPSGINPLFTCQPRVFSPKRGKTTVSFSLQKEASVTLKVYTIDGLLQKTLVSGETMYTGRNAVIWDGRDENDRIVSSGLYLIALSIDDGKVKTKAVVIQNR